MSTPHMDNIPQYYRTPIGDLFDLFMWKFGPEQVNAHMLMAAIEYLYRSQEKGGKDDVRKAKCLLERILDEPNPAPKLSEKLVALWCEANHYGLVRQASASPPASDEAPSAGDDDVASQLRAVEGMARALASMDTPQTPFLPHGDNGAYAASIVDEDSLMKRHTNAIATMEAMSEQDGCMPALPRDATILQAALWFWEQRHGQPHSTLREEITDNLKRYSWPPQLHYLPHAVKLHEELPGLFPQPGEKYP